jgi:N-glycosylase/DNA lyase
MKIKLPSLMRIPVPSDFGFLSTVYSHGWCLLPPFHAEKEQPWLDTVIDLPSEIHVPVSISPAKTQLIVHTTTDRSFSEEEIKHIRMVIRSMFRLDESFQDFYSLAQKFPAFRWIRRYGAGRLLRSQTVFEDIVKMICTTNCSWSLTQSMVNNLVHKLGIQISESIFAFPSPAVLAGCTEKFLREEIRCGYRAPYILAFAQTVTYGSLDPEKWRETDLSTEELYDQLHTIPGVGPYAAANVLKLLGRYEHLGIDSWCRTTFAELRANGRKVNDVRIEKYYSQFGKWRGLFMWFDLTRNWHQKKFPF